MYLTKELKDYYYQDFLKNVLTCDKDFWKLDDGLAPILIEINKNPFIQSLYSKKYSLNDNNFISSGRSYILFAFYEEKGNEMQFKVEDKK